MSQKSAKRTRRKTEEEKEVEADFKTPSSIKKDAAPKSDDPVKPKKNGTSEGEDTELKGFSSKEITDSQAEVLSGNNITNSEQIEVSSSVMQTRSRSSTPQNRKAADKAEEEHGAINGEEEPKINTENEPLSEKLAPDSAEMDPLVLESESPVPELMFDENSEPERESDKGSPVLRSKTRRSQSRNLPTPKTPKLLPEENDIDVSTDLFVSLERLPAVTVTDVDAEVPPKSDETPLDVEATESLPDVVSVPVLDINDSEDSVSVSTDTSTRVLVGNDTTRNNFDFSIPESSLYENDPDSFLSKSKDHSFGEMVRRLSARRSVRPGSTEDFRKRLLKGNLDKDSYTDFKTSTSLIYPTRQSVERISGIKRKHHSLTPDESKRYKADSSGIFSYISSPIANFKSRFTKTELPSSTPKLTGYKNNGSHFEQDDVSKIGLGISKEEPTEKKWCVIM